MSDTKPNGRWKAGQSGNPAGRKVGQRHRSTVILEKLMADDAKAIVATVLLAATAGDMTAARMILDRVVPAPKDRYLTMSITLPDTNSPEGINAAQGVIVAAVAAGDLLLSEGAALSALVEAQRRSVETNELASRIAALELKGSRT